MEKQIFELLRKENVGHAKAWYLTHELLRLFSVSGSCNHEFVWLKPDEDNDLNRRCEKCGYVELHDH
jgi:hypothetical protein